MTTPSRAYREIPVTHLGSGLELKLGVHEIRGAGPGPVLGLTGAIHGDEMIGAEILRRVVQTLNAAELRGTLRVMPVANPLGFEALTRNTPIDMNNLNRVFPGDPEGWLTEHMAHRITEGFLKTLDYYVDLHAGGAHPVVDYVYILNAEELSRAFGSPVLYRPKAGYQGTTSETTVNLGIPSVTVELGGGPNEEAHIQRGVRGIFNIMRKLGMLPGEPETPPKQTVVRHIGTIRPKFGGILVPATGLETLGTVIEGRQVLARIYNPMTLELLETITAPYERNLMILLRGTVTKVHPGDYAYMIGDMSSAE